VWTPKRILLLTLGVMLCVGGFVTYSRILGVVDGLPALPELYYPCTGPTPPPPQPRPMSQAAIKLEKAFGRECRELRWAIKIDVPGRGLVLAASEFQILEDGRVKLTPLSLGLFGKSVGPDGTPEINTIRSDTAYLKFERPIQSVADMGKHRIVQGELRGKNIQLVNNHRTPGRHDDVSLEVARGPLYYSADKQRVWTDEAVEIQDWQSKPRPTRITGIGMVVDLLAEPPGPASGQARRQKQGDSIGGVKCILLRSAVNMDLYLDGKSGFLQGSKKADAKPAPAPAGKGKPGQAVAAKPAPEKTHLSIKTYGPFYYDIVKDFARFDRAPRRPRGTSPIPEYVEVTRFHDQLGPGVYDMLHSDHLELQFRKKETGQAKQPPPKGRTGQSFDLEIETAHAYGEAVVLTSGVDHLDAGGIDFHYDARTLTTILKGTAQSPMYAIKEGNEIHSRQLRLINTKEGQTAVAEGEGWFCPFDKNAPVVEKNGVKQRARPLKATWHDRMEWKKDPRSGNLDMLHLVGKACFEDRVNDQSLHADVLQVWLTPAEANKTGKAAPQEPGQSRRPHHLIATGNVRSSSKEFKIRDATKFVVWFHDAPPGARPPAPAGKPAADAKPAPGGGLFPAPALAPGAPAKGGKEEPRPPIDLKARFVEAHVLRFAERSQLQKMWCEGAVRVVQPPSKQPGTDKAGKPLPPDKGVDIRGETLQLTAHAEGNYLVVTGTRDDVARLELDKMLILGPEITVDQVANKASVSGRGAMTMESDTDFQGNRLRQSAPMTVHWNRSMVFYGQDAEFFGGVVADQRNARLSCQELRVYFDKPISLKEGQRGQKDGDKAKVRNLVCEKSAVVEDSELDPAGKLVKYQQIKGTWIVFENEEERADVKGPGEVRIMQRGDPVSNDEPGKKPAPAGQPKKPSEMTLTCVGFRTKMIGNRKSRIADFFTNVRVLHAPLSSLKKRPDDPEDPRMEIDLDNPPDRLPEGAMYLRSDQLKVRTTAGPDKKTYQEMEATGRVGVTAAEFYGQAYKVTFNELTDQVRFDGGKDGVATLFKITRPGAPPQKIVARVITYSRKTGKHNAEGVKGIQGN
jgi:lipopolysaccharide export system protein LptA